MTTAARLGSVRPPRSRRRWGDVLFDYRYLYYSQGGDKLIDNLSFGGFALGVNFRF